MSTSEIKNIIHTQFTRDTKIDYKTENRAVSVWFERWDTDKSGDFNDTEWDNYQAYLKKAEERQAKINELSINKDTISVYDNIITTIEKQYRALANKFDTIDNCSTWNKLLEFEQKHPSIYRFCLRDEEEKPEGSYEFDISAQGIGIYDEKNDCFTGEYFKRGCVTGLNELTEAERNEYIQLLTDSINSANTLKECINEEEKLNQEFDKYSALLDMTKSGVIENIPSPDDESKLYSQYVNIRSNANPFYKEIKEIEQKITTIRLKGTPTDEDLKQLEQYNIQLDQLYFASQQWTITDCEERPSLSENTPEEMPADKRFQITNFSGSVSYQDGSVSQETSMGISWNPNDSIHLNANVTNTAGLSAENKKFNDEVTANLEAGYNIGSFSVTSTTDINHSSDNTIYTQSLNTSYKNVSANITETVMSAESNNVNSTNASLTWNAGKYSATGIAELTESGNTYSVSSSADYKISMGSNAALKLSPNIKSSFNDATQNWTLNPTMNLSAEINTDNVKTVVTAAESHVTTFGKNETTTNHNFNAAIETRFKKWSFGTKFNDSNTPFSHSNTYGINASYNISEVGTLSTEISHEVSKTKGASEKNRSTMFTISLAAPLENIRKLFSF